MKPARTRTRIVLLLFALLSAAQSCSSPPAPDPVAYEAEIAEHRRQRDHTFHTSPFSQLALIHREYLQDSPRVTIGSSPDADVRLVADGVAPLHALIEQGAVGPHLRALGRARVHPLTDSSQTLTELPLEPDTAFRVGRFNLRYIDHRAWKGTLEVYDPELPILREFTGMDYFPADPAYRVTGRVVPAPAPEQINLIDSHGNPRPYWVYGELRFALQGTDSRLEIYSTTIDPAEIARGRFMLMFTDATSGRESYPAARYLYVEGKPAGRVAVDFNRAFTPPCNYSPVFTCPFPRSQNRLPVAVRAGQKWFRHRALLTEQAK